PDQQIGPHLIQAINSLAKIAHCYMTLSREQSAVRTGQLTRSEAVNVSQRTWTDRVLIGRRERLQGNSPGCRRIGKLALSRQFALVGTASSQPACLSLFDTAAKATHAWPMLLVATGNSPSLLDTARTAGRFHKSGTTRLDDRISATPLPTE